MNNPALDAEPSTRFLYQLNLLADGLAEKDFAILDEFLTAEETVLLSLELQEQFDSGLFKPAGTGKSANYHFDQNIRGDHIRWITKENLAEPCQFLFEKLDSTILFLNQTLFLGIRDSEFHFAKYPAGSFFKRHRDAFKNDSSRKISLVLYLNENWKAEDGGQLRLYLSDPAGKECPLDIFPVSGRLACFRSDVVEHEVLPARRDRLSITGWLKNSDPVLF